MAIAIALVLTATGVAVAAPASAEGRLGFGSTASMATFKPLTRATVKGKVFIGFNAAGVTRAAFYLDDPTASKEPLFIDSQAPFTLGPSFVDTTKLKNGVHTLMVQATTAEGSTDMFARFKVANAGTATSATPVSSGTGTASGTRTGTGGTGATRTNGGTRAGATPKVAVGKTVLFRTDFENNSTAGWKCQNGAINGNCPNNDSTNLKFVKAPQARVGNTAVSFILNDGDSVAGGERSEIQSNDPKLLVHEGDERWYQWSTQFPANEPNPDADYFIIMQWHSSSGSPPLAINVNQQGILEVGGDGVKSAKKQPIGPMPKGKWNDYVLHVKFSQNASTGFIEAWENGKLVTPRYQRATMVDGENYLKAGIYRRSSMGGTSTVWLDNLVVTAP